MDDLKTSAHVTGIDPVQLIKLVELDLIEHDLRPKTTDDCLECDTGIGILKFKPVNESLEINVCAQSESRLYMLRESVEAHLGPLLHDAPAKVVWSGHTAQSLYPPHFRAANIIDQKRITPGFIRLRTKAPHLGPYVSEGMHFRLLLPPKGRDPVWPKLDEQGRTIWPEGKHRLHVAVYTVQNLDAHSGWFEFDVYMHGNGPTCAWAADAAGDQIGTLGPGGGSVPTANHLLLMGDETALPAISRIWNERAHNAEIEVFVSLSDTANLAYLEQIPKDTITLVDKSPGTPHLATALQKRLEAKSGNPFIWFAAERSEARAARDYANETNIPRDHYQIASYWTR